MEDGSRFKVIIVGGSIAGLSLAHCLQKAGIKYIVLEKRPTILVKEGASIAILPNGGRILEQLGLYDAVEELIEPLHIAEVRLPDGFQFSNSYPKNMHQIFGFPMAFLGRRELLQILYQTLPEKSNVYVDSTVVRVDYQEDNGVLVYTHDGRYYQGDLVVGADGVHSRLRTQMWRLGNALRPGMITDYEKKGMTVNYACIFGISSAVPKLKIGHLHLSVYDGISFIIAPGIKGRLSWFVVLKLDRIYEYGSAPRFSLTDAALQCEQMADLYIWDDVQFAQLWQYREVFSMTALEENIFQTWHCGRIVCIGDSMHKMMPTLGQGANCAIEDAASLANSIYDGLKTKTYAHRLSDPEIEYVLCRFSRVQFYRMAKIYKVSRVVGRLLTRDNIFWWLILRYYIPYAGNDPTERALKIFEEAMTLKFIPLPLRSGPRWTLPRKNKLNIFGWIGAAFAFILALAFMLLAFIW